MSSVSGLSAPHRAVARELAVQAASLALHNAPAVHYTQDARRWQGINEHLVAAHGHFPDYVDCSAFVTWAIWNGLFVRFGARDTVNGQSWRAGFTGTLLTHGKAVKHEADILHADYAIYGHGGNGEHTALCVGGGKVISMGSEAGPLLLPLHYRPDLMQIRRAI